MQYASPENRQTSKKQSGKPSNKQEMEILKGGQEIKTSGVEKKKIAQLKLGLDDSRQKIAVQLEGHSKKHKIHQPGDRKVYEKSAIEELRGLPGGSQFLDNNDKAGNSIISRITRSLGSLKTLSGAEQMNDDGNRNFNLFSHHQLVKENKPLQFTYNALKEGVLELYLSVKIRSDEEIDNYNEEFFKEEKKAMADVDGFSLIDLIKSSIEVLMNMKVEEQDEIDNPDLYDDSSNFLKGTINRHEQSERSPFKKRRSTHEIENKHININVGANNNLKTSFDDDNDQIIGMPEIDSREGDRIIPDKRQDKQKMAIEKNLEEKNKGLFEQSPSSTVKDLQRKLDQVMSPSDSKVSQLDDNSQSSIPLAHKEYEKIL